jgi:hypothetical protein
LRWGLEREVESLSVPPWTWAIWLLLLEEALLAVWQLALPKEAR